jgi:hypothetical protein
MRRCAGECLPPDRWRLTVHSSTVVPKQIPIKQKKKIR